MRKTVKDMEPYSEYAMPRIIHRFEVGRMYHYKFFKDKAWSDFKCTHRNGNRITLTEYKGNRVFEGEIKRASTDPDEIIEYLDCGIEHHGTYDKAIQIPARNYLYGRECRCHTPSSVRHRGKRS